MHLVNICQLNEKSVLLNQKLVSRHLFVFLIVAIGFLISVNVYLYTSIVSSGYIEGETLRNMCEGFDLENSIWRRPLIWETWSTLWTRFRQKLCVKSLFYYMSPNNSTNYGLFILNLISLSPCSHIFVWKKGCYNQCPPSPETRKEKILSRLLNHFVDFYWYQRAVLAVFALGRNSKCYIYERKFRSARSLLGLWSLICTFIVGFGFHIPLNVYIATNIVSFVYLEAEILKKMCLEATILKIQNGGAYLFGNREAFNVSILNANQKLPVKSQHYHLSPTITNNTCLFSLILYILYLQPHLRINWGS